MGKTKYIIFFDLDGTLLNIDNRWYQLHLDLSKYYNFRPLSKKDYLEEKKNGLKEEKIIEKTDIQDKKIILYVKKRIKLIETQKYLQFDSLKAGVTELLDKLLINHRLILVTKRTKINNCLNELKKFHLLSYFSKILITKQGEKYLIIKKNFKIDEIKNALFIGDTEQDFQQARILHCKNILITDGARKKNQLEKLRPDHIVDSISGLFKILINE